MDRLTNAVPKKAAAAGRAVSAPFRADLQVWMDGEFVAWQDATVHVMAHVLHYGSSVFEGIRC